MICKCGKELPKSNLFFNGDEVCRECFRQALLNAKVVGPQWKA